VRALADTLRSEALIYSGRASHYTIHCAFPSNFISSAFVEEQNSKPELTKEMEGTTVPVSELTRKLHSAKQVACYILSAVERGDFAICSELEAAMLFSNMIGPSPARGLGIMDFLTAVLMRFIIWPILRRRFDTLCIKDGQRREKSA
jgi:3-dehydrosphinganine reductase